MKHHVQIFLYVDGDAGKKYSIAVVGGGPGGLFSAWHLGFKLGDTAKLPSMKAKNV